MRFKIVLKRDRHSVHGYFGTLETAQKHLRETIPKYCQWGYFTDKTLTPEDFEIVEV